MEAVSVEKKMRTLLECGVKVSYDKKNPTVVFIH